jgi:hypothetical protein
MDETDPNDEELWPADQVARYLNPDKPLSRGAVWKEMQRARISSVVMRGYPARLVRAYKTTKRKGKGYRSDLHRGDSS